MREASLLAIESVASGHPAGIAGIAGMSIVVLFCVLNDRKNNKSGAPNALEWPITKIGGEGKWEDRDDVGRGRGAF